MANWVTKLDLRDITAQVQDGNATAAQMAGVIADRLEALEGVPQEVDAVRLELVRDFRDLSSDASLDNDGLDNHLEDLYDWADTPLDNKWNGRKTCWVSTF